MSAEFDPDGGLARVIRQAHADGWPGVWLRRGGPCPMDPGQARSLLRATSTGPRRGTRSDPRKRKQWLGDWRRVLVENAAHAGAAHELIVITAPGAEVLPWDTTRCANRHPGRPCSGKLGCRVDVDAAREWNRTAAGRHEVDGDVLDARWTRLHRAAAQRVRRELGPFKIVARVWEPQARGVLHQNVVVPASTPLERRQADAYRQALGELAPAYGFGFVSRKRRQMSGLHAGRYIAKYLSEGTHKLGMGDLVARDDAPRVIALVGRHLTVATESTMRACRERRVVWSMASRLAPLTPDGCSLEQAREVRAKLEKMRRYRQMALSARRRQMACDGDDWNTHLGRSLAEAEQARVVEDAHARWLFFQLARSGLSPEWMD